MDHKIIFSERAKIAMGRGERIYHDWSQKVLLDEIKIIEDQEGVQADSDVIALIKSIGEIYFPRVRGYFLYASSWHHVNGNPEIFYYLDEDLIFNGLMIEEYHELITRVIKTIKYWDKPEFYRIITFHWCIVKRRKEHTSSYKKKCFAVLYRGYFYTEDGAKYENRQFCGEAISSRIKPSNKRERDTFAKIIRRMQLQEHLQV